MEDRLYKNAGEYTRKCLDDLLDDCYFFLDEENDISNDYLHTYNYRSFAEGLTEYIQDHGYTGDVSSVADKVEFVLAKCTENGVAINRANIRNWFTDIRPKRSLVYQLCFGMSFSIDEVVDFFMKVYFECPFNYRDHNEAVYYYCFANGLKFSDAQRIIAQAETILNARTSDEPVLEFTHLIGSALKKVHTEKELLSYIEKNSHEFFCNNRTAQNNANVLIDDACELAVKMYDLEITRISGKNLNRKKNIDFLLFQLLGADIVGYKGDKSFAKAAELPDIIKSNFPLKMQLSNIRNGKPVSYETMRKALILLSFYCYFASLFYDHRNEKMFCSLEEDFREFIYETDDMLISCGYPKLYIRNPFDWLIMHCAFVEYPLDEFKNAIERYYTDVIEDF